MSSAGPGRLRDFFSSRTGIALVVVVALCLAGATAFALRGEDEADPRGPAAPTTTTTTVTAPPAQPTGGVLLGASTSPEIRGLAAEKAAVEELEQRHRPHARHRPQLLHVGRGLPHRASSGGTCRPAGSR